MEGDKLEWACRQIETLLKRVSALEAKQPPAPIKSAPALCPGCGSRLMPEAGSSEALFGTLSDGTTWHLRCYNNPDYADRRPESFQPTRLC